MRLRLTLISLLLNILPVHAQETQQPVIVASVVSSDVADQVEALGTLLAQESVTLTAAVTETITAIHFNDGDRVSAGQILVEMTSAEEHALLEEARATVAEATSQYERVASLAQVGNASAALRDQRKRELETAQARLHAIQSQLDDRLISAPFAGVVGLRDLSPGALVQPGTVITTLDDDSVMKLEFTMPATLLADVRPGLSVAATTRAYPQQLFTGTVSAIDSRVDPIDRSVTVRALIANPQRVLKPGLLMKVKLHSNPRQALLIPEEALVPLGPRQYVFRADAESNTVAQQEITIGQRFIGQVEVLSGLAVGDWVVTHGADRLHHGQSVTIRHDSDPQAALQQRPSPDTATTAMDDSA